MNERTHAALHVGVSTAAAVFEATLAAAWVQWWGWSSMLVAVGGGHLCWFWWKWTSRRCSHYVTPPVVATGVGQVLQEEYEPAISGAGFQLAGFEECNEPGCEQPGEYVRPVVTGVWCDEHLRVLVCQICNGRGYLLVDAEDPGSLGRAVACETCGGRGHASDA